MAVLGEEALGVELDPLDRQFAVAQAHELSPVDRPGGRLQALRQGIVHHQAVVAGGGERRRQAAEDAAAVVADLAGLAMHQPGRPLDHPAEGLADRLVPEADPEQGRALAGGGADQREADAGLGGRARPGRDDEVVGLLRHHLLDRAFVIAVDRHLGTQLPQVLDEVVGEAVIVVDDDQHGRAAA